MTLPVVAPVGTGTVMLVVFQAVGVAVTPLNFTVLVPCGLPNFVPVITTDVPATPDVGLSPLIVGAVPPVPFADLKAAKPPAQLSEEPMVAVAVEAPEIVWIWSSTTNFAFPGPGILSSILKLAPAVIFWLLATMIVPINRSPLAVVFTLGALLGAVLNPCAEAATSSDPEVATPEYSRIEKRRVPKMLSETLTVFAPAPI